MSQLKVTTLEDSAGGTTDTKNLTNACCKAWANVTWSGGVPTLNGKYNISSITDDGVGVVTFNFTTSLATGDGKAVFTTAQDAPDCTAPFSKWSATQFDAKWMNTSGTAVDPTRASVAII